MELSEYLNEIVSRACTLHERLENRVGKREPELFAATGKRLEEWKECAAQGDEVIFRRRLLQEDITDAELSDLLEDSVELKGPLPEWASHFGCMAPYFRSMNFEEADNYLRHCFSEDIIHQVPFIHLIVPWVRYATDILRTNLDLDTPLFAPETVPGLQQQLFSLLSRYAGETFQLEFTIFRRLNRTSWERLLEHLDEKPGQELYRRYSDRFFHEGWPEFFREYAVLARILSVVTGYWIENTTLLWKRLTDDYSLIARQLHQGSDPGRIVEIAGGMSDSHHHGKRVHTIRFDSGLKVIYKPKSLALEKAYSSLIRWVNGQGARPDLKPLDVIDRGNYGWVGFIEAGDCVSEQQVRDYYKRMGMLLCIVYMLKGNDCHYENLIASGEYPILIDLETIMHHSSKYMIDEDVGGAFMKAFEKIGNSVFRSGLLPFWVVGKDNIAYDVSGMWAAGHQQMPFSMLRWKEINTDRMETFSEQIISREHDNIPRYMGDRRFPSDYTGELVEGFSALYRLLVTRRDQIPVGYFAGNEVRFVFRSTRIYAMINKKLMNPAYMRCGIDRSLQMEVLCRPFLHEDGKSRFWDIARSELQQMEEYDIPIFHADISGKDLFSGQQPIMKDFMEAPVLDQVIDQIKNLSEEDLALQEYFIRASLFLRNIQSVNPKAITTRTKAQHALLQPWDPGRMVGHARKIGDLIHDKAIWSDDGSVAWITVSSIADAGKYLLRPIPLFVYDGYAGVALFFSALYTITGEGKYLNLTQAILRSVYGIIRQISQYPPAIRYYSLGIGSGIGSLIYALVKVSRLIGDDTPVGQAEVLAGLVDDEAISRDTGFDLIGGAAGAVMAFLALHEVTRDPRHLVKAVRCGDHLLQKKSLVGEGQSAWKRHDGLALTGFSHGGAGIACSLLRLYERTGEQRFMDSAVEAIRYEDSFFYPEHRNWEDLRVLATPVPDKGPRFMTSWCHGAPGIALGRIITLPVSDGDRVRFFIEQALETTKAFELDSLDHLCCGNMGRIGILHYAGSRLGRDELILEAKGRILQLEQKMEKRGRFDVFHDPGIDLFHLGFFQGLSGIGYELMRVAYPDRLPFILAFE
jgi:type 2 lantibiotic biosynthesis protein LanM